MTLAAGSIVNSYIGTGGTNSYPFTFPVFLSTDLVVVVTDLSSNQTVLTFATDYTVSGLSPIGGPPATGTITLVNSGQAWLTAGNLTSGWTITLTRTVSIAQLTSIRNQGDFYQEVLESTLDYLTMICQQLSQDITNPVVGASITIVIGDLTIGTAGAGMILTTPDGTKTARVSIDNNVNLIVTRLT